MSARARISGAAALTLAALVLRAPSAHAGDGAGDQPASGAELYRAHCASCHGRDLGGGFGPALNSTTFRNAWRAEPPGALENRIATTMPPGGVGRLSPADYHAVTAFITSPPLRRDPLGRIVRPAETNQDATAQAIAHDRATILTRMRAVDDATLAAPPPGDWLLWRRTYDAHAASPLAAIDRHNVQKLAMVWSRPLAAGANQIVPLVHDGVLFLTSGHETLALNGASGDLLWTYARTGGSNAGLRTQSRSIALYGDHLFVPTIDAHMIALDARSGALLWDREVAPAAKGAQLIAGPLIAAGTIVQGVAGCATDSQPGGCYLLGLDPADGTERWRVHTIARPGEPGGESWNGAAINKRFGGAIWSTPSYSAATGLVYVGTGQTYRTETLRNPALPSGPANAARHTDSTLAVDPRTGRLAWAFQHLAHDIWDFDWGYEQTLATIGGRTLAISAGKLGIVDAVDARTGAFAFSRDIGLQHVVTGIDARTGWKTTDPALDRPTGADGIPVCPSSFGVRNWPATAYDAASGILYLPMFESCMSFFWDPGTPWDISWKIAPPPESDGRFGRVQAIDLATGKPVWTHRDRAPASSALLLTAGGLLFSGDRSGAFRALDSRTGEVLWQVNLGAPPNAFPITFEANGRQYVAIVAGGGGPLDQGLASFTPELRPATGNPILYVFALPHA